MWNRLAFYSEICAPFPTSWMNEDNFGMDNEIAIILKTVGIVLYVVTIPTRILLIYGAECFPLFICATVLQVVHQYNLELDSFKTINEGKLFSLQDRSSKNDMNNEVSCTRFENVNYTCAFIS